MIRSSEEIDRLLDDIYLRLVEKVTFANRTGKLEELLNKYDYYDKSSKDTVYIDFNRAKILLVGDLQIKQHHIYRILKDSGLTKDKLEHINYYQAKTFNWNKLQHSNTYTDIFMGPIPHKVADLGNYSSMVAKIESNLDDYPMLHKLGNEELKISKTNFIEALNNSEMLKMLVQANHLFI